MKKKSVIARLMEYAGHYSITMVLSWIFSAAGGVLSLGPYICIYFVARELLGCGGDFTSLNCEVLTGFGWKAVIFTGFSFGVYGLGLMLSHITAFNLMAKIRTSLVRRLGELSLGFHTKHPSGKLRKLIEKNTENMENFIAHQLPDTAQAVVMPVAFLGSILFFDWKLALICLLPIAVGFVMLGIMLKSESRGFLAQYQEAMGDMSNAAVEYVRGIAVVKVFGQTVHSFRRFHDSIDTYRKFITCYALSMEKPMSGYIAAVHGIFFVLVPAGIVIYQAAANQGDFILSLVFFIVFTPLTAVMLMRIMYSSSNRMITEQALDRVDELLSEVSLPQTVNPQDPSGYDIVFDSVSFRYEKEALKAIDDLSFCAKEGSVTALVGPSGGGKSTIASLIARFWDVDSGSISIGGVDVRELDYNRWIDRISFVFQDVNLFKMSVADNVSFNSPDATEEEILNALHLAQCDDIIEKLPDGINTVIGTKGIYVSGGEMQRIALARAILKDASVVLLDEATAFADPENEYKIQKALNVLMKGKTVIMIAHRLSTVTNADQIMVMKDGGLAECGRHDELMACGGLYAKMYEEYRRSTSWKIGDGIHA